MEGFQAEGGPTPYPHIALCATAPKSIYSRRILAARGLCSRGIDPSPEMIRVARRDHLGFDFDVADLRELPFGDASLQMNDVGRVANVVSDDMGYPAPWQALPGVVFPQASEAPPCSRRRGPPSALTSLDHSVGHDQLYLGLKPQSRYRKRSGGTLLDPDSFMQESACQSQAAPLTCGRPRLSVPEMPHVGAVPAGAHGGKVPPT